MSAASICCPICGLTCSSQLETCPRCGERLSVQNQTLPVFQTIPAQPKPRATAPFTPPARLTFHIEGQLLTLPDRSILTIGRQTPDSHAVQPDIDLTAFGAASKGVSRLHCQLKKTQYLVYLADLNSRNGTWLNGARLLGERLIRNGDEVQLGHLRMTVRFDPATG